MMPDKELQFRILLNAYNKNTLRNIDRNIATGEILRQLDPIF